MKQITSLSLALIFLFCVVSGCKKSNVTTTPSNSTFISGTWAITSFKQKAEDKTSDFSGLDFTFSSDSKLVVSGSKNVTGSWSYIAPTSDYYGNSTPASFNINVGTESPLQRLTRAWSISQHTNDVLKLDALEISEDEHVTFSKK